MVHPCRAFASLALAAGLLAAAPAGAASLALRYADQPTAIAALAAQGLSAHDQGGNAVLPGITSSPGCPRADVLPYAGTGVLTAPTGATQPGPTLPGSTAPGPAVPVYAAKPGFYLTLVCSGALDPSTFGAAVTTDFVASVVEAGPPLGAAVPDQVPMWAMQAALQLAGKYAAINQAVLGWADASDPNEVSAYFAWTMGNYASRGSAFIATFAAQFKLAPADVDALFVTAGKIAGSAG